MATLVAAPLLLDLLGPAHGGPAGVGTAPGGTFVWMYASANCTGPEIEGQWVGRDGAFEIGFFAPTADTAYSARAMSWTGEQSACSSSLTYHVIHDECPVTPSDRPVTRPSRSSITVAGDYMPQFVYGDQSDGSLADLQLGIKLEEPELMWIGGFGLFHHMHTGSVSGYASTQNGATVGSPIVGNWSPISIADSFKVGPLPPADLRDRQEILADYLSTLAPHTRPGIYMDFGTQVYSNAERTQGLWQFHAQWEAFDAELGLGAKPPPVDEWLRRTWDPTFVWPSAEDPDGCQIPADFAGLAPDYCPDRGNGIRRFAMNPLSQGFNMYWSVVLRWMAIAGYRMAFVDNVYMHRCWNQECEDGYDDWIASRYTPAQIDRYLTQTTSRITQHASFDLWDRDADGDWIITNNAIYTAPNAGGYATIAPDIDAVRGRYSLRTQTTGPSGGTTMSLPLDGPPGTWRLDLHLRTDCAAPTIYVAVPTSGGGVLWDRTFNLPSSATWISHSVPFVYLAQPAPITPQIQVIVYGNTIGCTLWLDDLAAVLSDESPGAERRLHRQIDDTALHLRRTETRDYWDSIVDDRLPALKQAALAVDPDFWLFTNSFRQRRGAEAFMVERALLESEDSMIGRGSFPGTYAVTDPSCAPTEACHPSVAGSCSCIGGKPIQTDTTVDNILDYRVAAAYDRPDEFAYHVHNAARLDGHYMHNERSAVLALAEAAAFSGGALSDLQIDYEYYKYYPASGSTLRALKAAFVDWSEANAELYACLVSSSTVGLVMRDKDEASTNAVEVRQIALADALSDAGITFDVIAAPGLIPDNLARYRAIAYEGVPRVDSDEVAMLVAYMNAGGIVFASGDAGRYDEYFRRWDAFPAPAWPPVALAAGQTVYPVGAGAFVWLPDGITAAAVAAQLPDAVAFPSLAPEQLATTRAAFWSAPDRVVAHVLDYATPIERVDGGTPAPALLVDLEVRIPAGGLTPTTAQVYAPAGAGFQGALPVTVAGGVATVVVPSVDVYAVIVLR